MELAGAVGPRKLIVVGCNHGGKLHQLNSLRSSSIAVCLSVSSFGLNRNYNRPLTKQASGLQSYTSRSSGRRISNFPSLTTNRNAALNNTAAESSGSEEAIEEEFSEVNQEVEAVDYKASQTEQDTTEVTEVFLSGEDTKVREISDSLYSFKTLKKLVFRLGEGGRHFVVNSVGGVLRMGKKSEDEPDLIAFGTSMYENKDGVSALHQWTATEMTMQHAQLVRIERDINYLVFAFSFFGWVRICEAMVHAFSVNPPKLKRLMQASNAMDPLTVAWLAYNLRKPIAGMLLADPTDLEKLAHLKGKLWEELHAFFERQWKVMATIAMARFLSLIASKIPTSQWITSKVKLVWDMLMALPIF